MVINAKYYIVDKMILEKLYSLLIDSSTMIDKNWFYHATSLDTLESILTYGILSLKKQNKTNRAAYRGFNGQNYISLSKKYQLPDNRHYSSYDEYIRKANSLIIDSNIAAIYTSSDSRAKRKSIYYDEYQIRDVVKPQSIMGITTNLTDNFFYPPIILDELINLRIILDILEKTHRENIFFLDSQSERVVDKKFIFQYVKKR